MKKIDYVYITLGFLGKFVKITLNFYQVRLNLEIQNKNQQLVNHQNTAAIIDKKCTLRTPKGKIHQLTSLKRFPIAVSNIIIFLYVPVFGENFKKI